VIGHVLSRPKSSPTCCGRLETVASGKFSLAGGEPKSAYRSRMVDNSTRFPVMDSTQSSPRSVRLYERWPEFAVNHVLHHG
jgi:hypothetical protein